MPIKIYTAGQIFTGEKFIEGFAIEVDSGKVRQLISQNEIPNDSDIFSYPDLIIAPAFKDLQINGGDGRMFSIEPTVESLTVIRNYCRSGGVSSFLATVATSSPEIISRAINSVLSYWESGADGLIGLHLEGPYINIKKKGAHAEKFIEVPDIDNVKRLVKEGTGVIKMMTLAPELCSDEVIKYLINSGIILSAGHSNATYEQAMHGFELGIKTCTHLYNAMTPFNHRNPGIVGAIFDSNVFSSIIPDGIHLSEVAFRIANRLLGDRLFFITDAVTESETEYYHYIFKDHYYVNEKGVLSGSALKIGTAIRKAVAMGITREEALKKASTIPSLVIGKGKIWGRIAPGYLVDWVLLDKELNVKGLVTG